MSNSPLVTYTRISPNRTSPRNHAIDRVTIHCYVGQVTAERGCSGARFTTYDPVGGASCNYVVGCDGSIGLCVPENDRSWCSSNRANDHRAVTIETASDTVHPYAVTGAAYSTLLDLVTDICRRNGKRKLLWMEDKAKALAYMPAADEMVLTVHRWFAAKACPGQYLLERHEEIAAEVTRRLQEEVDNMTEDQIRKIVREEWAVQEAKRNNATASSWAVEYIQRALQAGILAGVDDGQGGKTIARPQGISTREEMATMGVAILEAVKTRLEQAESGVQKV